MSRWQMLFAAATATEVRTRTQGTKGGILSRMMHLLGDNKASSRRRGGRCITQMRGDYLGLRPVPSSAAIWLTMTTAMTVVHLHSPAGERRDRDARRGYKNTHRRTAAVGTTAYGWPGDRARCTPPGPHRDVPRTTAGMSKNHNGNRLCHRPLPACTSIFVRSRCHHSTQPARGYHQVSSDARALDGTCGSCYPPVRAGARLANSSQHCVRSDSLTRP